MFQLLSESNTPTVIGKAWWNEALKHAAPSSDGRRAVLIGAGIFGALIVGPPVCGFLMSDDDDDRYRKENRSALQAQREYGWSFGAADQVSTIGVGLGPPPPSPELDNLTAIMAPKNPRWTPAWVPTLFQSLNADAPHTAEDRRDHGFTPLRDVVRPSIPVTAVAAAAEGEFLKDALANTMGVAVVVDLPGPDSVVYAMHLADRFDPVFLFDNWPHPRGVVKVHETLSAALAAAKQYQQKKEKRQQEAPPCFVLDRTRLAPYSDAADQFDNRSLARLPPVDMLKNAGISKVFYAAPMGSNPFEMDDVVDDLVAWQAAGIAVHGVAVSPNPATGVPQNPTGAIATREAAFARDHGLAIAPGQAASTSVKTPQAEWKPAPRASAFSSGAPVAVPSHPHPAGFGEVPVVVEAATGILVGAALYRSGSWNRAPPSSTYYGGG